MNKIIKTEDNVVYVDFSTVDAESPDPSNSFFDDFREEQRTNYIGKLEHKLVKYITISVVTVSVFALITLFVMIYLST